MSRFRLALAKWGVQIGGMSERTTSAQQARAERVTRAAAASLGRRAARAIGRAPLLTVYILAREAAHCALYSDERQAAEAEAVLRRVGGVVAPGFRGAPAGDGRPCE